MTSQNNSSNFPFDPLKNAQFAPIPLPILSFDKLIHVEKELYGILRMFAGNDGECFPKDSTMANLLNVSERTIKRAIAKLIDLKLIRKFKKNGLRHFEFLPHEIFNKPKNKDKNDKNKHQCQQNDTDDCIPSINKKNKKPYKVFCDRINPDDLNSLNGLCELIAQKIPICRFNPFQFAQAMLKRYKHINSIIEALQAIIKAIEGGKNIIKNFWAYCLHIVSIQSGNYYAREEDLKSQEFDLNSSIIFKKISENFNIGNNFSTF